MTFETCTTCGHVLTWSGGTLVCPHRDCIRDLHPNTKGTMTNRRIIPTAALNRATPGVQAAQHDAVAAIAAADAAGDKLRQAREARIAAPAEDANALEVAVRAGKTPPHATLPGCEADERAAQAVVKVLAETRQQAVNALHRAIIDDRRDLIANQGTAVTEQQTQALALLDEATAQISATLDEHATLRSYLDADEYTVGVRGEKRHPRIGKLNFAKPAARDAKLREALATARTLLAEIEASATTTGDHIDEQHRRDEELRQRRRNGIGNIGRGVLA